VLTPDDVAQMLGHMTVIDRTIVMTDVAAARLAAEKYAVMNREWWAGPTEAYIYNEFADALREAFRLGILHEDDLLADDTHVLDRLQGAASPLIAEKLDRILNFRPERAARYVPRIIPKTRWLDPPVCAGGAVRRLSEIDLIGHGPARLKSCETP
jgi:hypothetical protein